MFVGRQSELDMLQEAYEDGKFQCAVLYGRRRIGKSYMLSRFVQGKPAIFFTAQEVNDKLNFSIFTERVLEFFGLKDSGMIFQDWDDIFKFLVDQAKKERLILVLDEFPCLCNANKEIRLILRNAIDQYFQGSNLFLILCGSQISFMEREVLGSKSPLFGCCTLPLYLTGFDYLEAAKLLQDFSDEDKVRLYACVGDTPHYLSQVDPKLTLEENIKRLFFRSSGYLYSELFMLLQQELREPAVYNSIIMAIVSGAERLNDIVLKTGEEKTKVSKYIKVLLDVKILERVSPYGEDPEKSRRGIYQFSDYCCRFWYRFVFGNQDKIDRGVGEQFADQMIFGKVLDDFIANPAFEQVCQQYLVRLNQEQKLPFFATSFGKWWENERAKQEELDLDIVMGDKEEKRAVIGECKWSDGPVTKSEIENWLNKSSLLPGYEDRYYVCFSKEGYAEEAYAVAKENRRLKLLGVKDLFQRKDSCLFEK